MSQTLIEQRQKDNAYFNAYAPGPSPPRGRGER
jgi:hypothetical protein